MESRLEKDISLTPRRIAYEYRYYKAIDRRMEPYLRRIATELTDFKIKLTTSLFYF